MAKGTNVRIVAVNFEAMIIVRRVVGTLLINSLDAGLVEVFERLGNRRERWSRLENLPK